MGSLIYISPQQRENPHAAQFTDDVFALRQIAYHVLSGHSPHGGIEGLSELGYSVWIDTCVRTLRNPDASRRPESAIECLTTWNEMRIDIGTQSKKLRCGIR